MGRGAAPCPQPCSLPPAEPPTISKASRGKGGLWGGHPITVPGPRPGLQKRQVVPPPHIPPTRHGVFLPLIFESSHQYSNKAGAAPRLCALLAAQQGQGCATATPLCYPHQALRGTEGRAAPHHHTEPGTTYLPLPAASRGILRPQRISGVSAGEWEQANRVQDRQQHVAGQHPEHGAGVLVTPLLLCPGCQEVQSPLPPPTLLSPLTISFLCFPLGWARQASSCSAQLKRAALKLSFVCPVSLVAVTVLAQPIPAPSSGGQGPASRALLNVSLYKILLQQPSVCYLTSGQLLCKGGNCFFGFFFSLAVCYFFGN